MDGNSILSIVAIVLSVLGMIIGVINHKKIKSKCFGVDLGETSIDIESTKDSPSNLRIKVPKLPPSPKEEEGHIKRIK
jgi:hypothetical protein